MPARTDRRQLLQGCRHLEVLPLELELTARAVACTEDGGLSLDGRQIDCWDSRLSIKKMPVVTHGNTFCTTEKFDEVAKAVGECAFVAADLPVILSLEVKHGLKRE